MINRFQWGVIRACKLQGTGHLPSNQARTCCEWRLNLRPNAGPASRSSSESVWPQFCSPASFGPDQTWPVFSRFFFFHFSSLFSFVFSPGARTNFSCGFRGLLLSSYPLPPRFPKAHPSIHQCSSLFNGTSCISLHNWLVNLRSAHSNTNGVILNYFSFSVSYYYHSCIIIVIIIIMMIILVLLLSSLLYLPAHFHLPPLPSPSPLSPLGLCVFFC